MLWACRLNRALLKLVYAFFGGANMGVSIGCRAPDTTIYMKIYQNLSPSFWHGFAVCCLSSQYRVCSNWCTNVRLIRTVMGNVASCSENTRV